MIGHEFYRRPLALLLTVAAFVAVMVPSCAKPELPANPPRMTFTYEGMTSPTTLGAYSWPDLAASDTGDGHSVERWGAFLPDYPLFVEAGSSITVDIDIPQHPDSIKWEIFDRQGPYLPPGESKVVATGEITEFTKGEGSVSFSWKVPDLTATASETGLYAVILDVAWTKPSSAYATYYAVVGIRDKALVTRAAKVAADFFKAAWTQDRDGIGLLISADIKGRLDAVESGTWPAGGYYEYNPFYVSLDSSWDLLTWKSDRYTFTLKGEPEVRVRAVGRIKKDPWSEVELVYSVDVTDKTAKTTTRWDYNEFYLLNAVDAKDSEGAWVVYRVDRNGAPYLSQGGSERGWASSARTDGALTKAGPFSGVRLYQGKSWTDDGETLAFVADNFGRAEIWTIKRDGSNLKRVMSFDSSSAPNQQIRSTQSVTVLGWAPGTQAIRFVLSGYQSTGPYSGQIGFWIGELDSNSGQVSDVGFVSASGVCFLRDLMVSDDMNRVYFRTLSTLHRVDFGTREVTAAASDIPSADGLMSLKYSPSGKYAAYWDTADTPAIVVHDLAESRRHTIDVSNIPEGQSAYLYGWVSPDLLMVSIAEDDEVLHAEDSSWPVGATELRLYDLSGNIVNRLASGEVCDPESPLDRIGHWIWMADGSRMAFTVGPVDDIEGLGYWYVGPIQRAKSVWVWTVTGEELGSVKLAEVDGVPEEVAWVAEGPESGKAIEVWYRVPPDDQVVIQHGVAVNQNGQAASVERQIPCRTAGWEEKFGSENGYTYFLSSDMAISRITRKGPDGQSEVVLEADFRIGNAELKDGVITAVGFGTGFPSQSYLCLLDVTE